MNSVWVAISYMDDETYVFRHEPSEDDLEAVFDFEEIDLGDIEVEHIEIIDNEDSSDG